MSGFVLFPAIDVREGCVVRLRQGNYAHETRYADDPVLLARRYDEAGANWLHLVDLDAARHGGYTLAPLLSRIKSETDLQVQTGGGVRSESDVQRILDAGADRVVVGSLAVREPATVQSWLQSFGAERIAVALDTRRALGSWQLPISGWTSESGMLLHDLVADYAEAGMRHLLCTDIERDGMLAGPSLALYEAITAAAPEVRLQASGGLRDIDDILATRRAGCTGAVLGKALLEGRFDLAVALAAARARTGPAC